jgi:hypothetical protein
MLGYLLRQRKVWGLTLGFGAYGYSLLSVPDLVARLPGPEHAHEHPALGGSAATASACWSLPSLVAPAGGVGSVGSLMNLANNLMGAAARK